MWGISHRTNTNRRGDRVRLKLESRKNKNWSDGIHWKFEFSIWTLYSCDVYEEETEEMEADYCWYLANSKKELKQHKKEYHSANV
jgi:hypothetical protein